MREDGKLRHWGKRPGRLPESSGAPAHAPAVGGKNLQFFPAGRAPVVEQSQVLFKLPAAGRRHQHDAD